VLFTLKIKKKNTKTHVGHKKIHNLIKIK
jgi:hypothetical protein